MSNATAVQSGLARLQKAHPHHVERITAHVEAQGIGALVVMGRDEALIASTNRFFTGIGYGDTVVVTAPEQRAVQAMTGDVAHCSTDGAVLTSVRLDEWTVGMCNAAQRAALRGATEAMESALTAQTGWGRHGRGGNTERAMADLQRACDLRHYAFAVGVFRALLADAVSDEFNARMRER